MRHQTICTVLLLSLWVSLRVVSSRARGDGDDYHEPQITAPILETFVMTTSPFSSPFAMDPAINDDHFSSEQEPGFEMNFLMFVATDRTTNSDEAVRSPSPNQCNSSLSAPNLRREVFGAAQKAAEAERKQERRGRREADRKIAVVDEFPRRTANDDNQDNEKRAEGNSNSLQQSQNETEQHRAVHCIHIVMETINTWDAAWFFFLPSSSLQLSRHTLFPPNTADALEFGASVLVFLCFALIFVPVSHITHIAVLVIVCFLSATQFTLPAADNIHGGGLHTCALLESSRGNRVKCWGRSASGRLGLGDTVGRYAPDSLAVDLGTGFNPVQLDLGNEYTCVLSDEGEAKCFGRNDEGQLGVGNNTNFGGTADSMGNNLPVIALPYHFVPMIIKCGYRHTCILSTTNALRCFGVNNYGQVGVGDTADRSDPGLTNIDLGTGFVPVKIALGSYHTCVASSQGRVKCFGRGSSYGALGYGDTLNRGDGPNEMGDDLPFVDLGNFTVTDMCCGYQFTCALSTDGTVKCWGANNYGQLGLGDTNARGDGAGEMGSNLPEVDLGDDFVVIELQCGHDHVCALSVGNNLRCWGGNSYGQLGLEDTLNRGDDPDEMGNLLPVLLVGNAFEVAQIGLGYYHTCVTSSDDEFKCFGHNAYGQLGYGDTEQRGDGFNEMNDNLPAIQMGPTFAPSAAPSAAPTQNTNSPTQSPTNMPSASPSNAPTATTNTPSLIPTAVPTSPPTQSPSSPPTDIPSTSPTEAPSNEPSVPPTASPSNPPTLSPTRAPTRAPSKSPSTAPTVNPTTSSPTRFPSNSPSSLPTPSPTEQMFKTQVTDEQDSQSTEAHEIDEGESVSDEYRLTRDQLAVLIACSAAIFCCFLFGCKSAFHDQLLSLQTAAAARATFPAAHRGSGKSSSTHQQCGSGY